MRLANLSNRQIAIISIISFVFYLVLAVWKFTEAGHFVSTQSFKYPPRYYYLFYAFFALNAVYLWCRNIKSFRHRIQEIIVWISSSSLWIYLWHILGVFLWRYTIGNPNGSLLGFAAKTTFILGFGVAMTLAQQAIVRKHLVTRFRPDHPLIPMFS